MALFASLALSASSKAPSTSFGLGVGNNDSLWRPPCAHIKAGTQGYISRMVFQKLAPGNLVDSLEVPQGPCLRIESNGWCFNTVHPLPTPQPPTLASPIVAWFLPVFHIGLLPKISFEETAPVFISLKSTDQGQLLHFAGEKRGPVKWSDPPKITKLVAEKGLGLRLYCFLTHHYLKACVIYKVSCVFQQRSQGAVHFLVPLLLYTSCTWLSVYIWLPRHTYSEFWGWGENEEWLWIQEALDSTYCIFLSSWIFTRHVKGGNKSNHKLSIFLVTWHREFFST